MARRRHVDLDFEEAARIRQQERDLKVKYQRSEAAWRRSLDRRERPPRSDS